MAVLEVFWLTESQPQLKYQFWQPKRGIGKLQIGARKQALTQLSPKSIGVHDVERVQLSPDRRTQVVCAWKLAPSASSSDHRCPKEWWL
jgi:hypothetical protein